MTVTNADMTYARDLLGASYGFPAVYELAQKRAAEREKDWTRLPVSPYALQHPDAYGLRPTTYRDGKVILVELCLLDAEGEFVDEDGCECDLDAPCNNPTCVHERTWP